MRASYLFTSESVSEGHPDKVCDRISDEIVDLFFREGAEGGIDPYPIRVACETLATTNSVVIAGEVRGPEIGHQRPDRERGPRGDQGHRLRAGRLPLGHRDIEVLLHAAVGRHRPGRRRRRQQGRGRGRPGHHVRLRLPRNAGTDAGADLSTRTRSCRLLSEARRSGAEKALGPDAKSQVTVRYENGKPVGGDADRRLAPASSTRT